MRGVDLKEWRRCHGYNQEDLMKELGIGSRQTISTWEASDEISRTVELALKALKHIPECRRLHGKRISKTERRRFKKAM